LSNIPKLGDAPKQQTISHEQPKHPVVPEKKKFPWEDDQAIAKYDNLPIKSLADNKPMIPSM